ncbi:MAG: hypothetical protein UX99_C0007G0041 [Candidatus Amesbacteria bacterium GW2011_GWB1_47_26]|uniref:LytR/CpsA/Psr regulator C-terminal domain-containing protein n=1 Tax=Candidatus Amesbacteria bacterium GW2011_GWC2_45_19 TaxID=1618366 RepID=A0A0G1M3I9_9BACT|nr:MAG: hypothetical protein UX05_C0010G0019 [Candidatus Amesbacteria bacterium GW2011_GWC2_45_19]KKU38093.1 MAG: hypothetical protein UX52_C0011G0023 [Candidatus Amesbacteria bacterium GW2011_GWA1_46_35]KKU69066.1 MAG: hypothetical protein UX93_C0003G0058 [Microgenomates group bacterium GW2011_GWC1_47_20]KKU74753.1 MAG: hypothetical protein UX99_C0007G0041 [Candidatus Amesbacteria bacterium GW2011_GWB1_47_26]KKU80184.1 MAG: hypothetical protein UY06_C0004G0005 [Candidatus Amesbacteria bacteriu
MVMLEVMPVKKDKAEEEVITEVAVEEPAQPILQPQVVEDVLPAVAVAAEEPKKENGGWVWMLVAFVLGAMVGTVTGYLVAKTQKFQNSKTQNTTVVQTEGPAPSPSPAADVKKADLKVQVLNGSGVAGAAAKAKTFLEGLGYVDVVAGNADGDFAQTEMEIKESKSSAAEMIKKDLKGEYTLADTVGGLDASSDYDVVITLGAE